MNKPPVRRNRMQTTKHLGDVKWLFKFGLRIQDEFGHELLLLPRSAVCEFFGVTRQVIQGWERKGLLKVYVRGFGRNGRHYYAAHQLFDENKKLKFIPPTFGNLLERVMGDGEDVEALMKFLRGLR